jgi:hypothetical protein
MADEDLKDMQGDRYAGDQTFGAQAAEEADKVDELEAEGGAEAVQAADPGERVEPNAWGKADNA